MSVWANFADIFLWQCVTEVCEAERNWRGKSSKLIGQQQTNLSNRSSGVQIPRDICTRLGRYLYSTRCSWIINKNKLVSARSMKRYFRGGRGASRGGVGSVNGFLQLTTMSAGSSFPSIASRGFMALFPTKWTIRNLNAR